MESDGNMSVGSARLTRGGAAVLKALQDNGVDTIFGIPGVHTLDIYDALIDQGAVNHILARHEQGAGYMADGYARATGKPGVALIVTGPGITNASTAIGQAYADSAPVFIIATNQERRHLDKMVGNLHELTDQMQFMAPITKWSHRAMEAGDLPELVAQALEALSDGRPRPVHLEVPIDLLAEEIEDQESRTVTSKVHEPDSRLVDQAVELIAQARRVMIFAGGGATSPEASAELSELASVIEAPVITSVTGKGAISYDHPYGVGAYGYRWSADNPVVPLMERSDLAIVVGSGLGVRTSAEGAMPLPEKVIHIDIDPLEIEQSLYPATVGIPADAATTLRQLVEAVKSGGAPLEGWDEDKVRGVRDALLSPADERAARYLPYIEALRAGMDRDAILVNDMTMMAYEGVRYFPTYEPRSYIFPRGFGTLGSAMPTAIGAKVGMPDKQVVSVAGDGGFQFTMEELGTAVHHRIPIQIVIFDDGTHTAVKAAQQRTYPGRFIAVDLVNPDYVKIADAYGMQAIRAASPAALTDALQATRNAQDPVMVVVPINLEQY